jgi:hypothetical protein
MVSCIGFGSGTRFCSIESEDAAQALLGENIQAALGFTPASESDKQRLREKNRTLALCLGKFFAHA